MNEINKDFLNDVKNRFLPLPRNATEEYEKEPKITDFEIVKELGIGSFGKVYLVYHKKTKAKFALKSIYKLDEVNFEEKSYFSREIEIMYKLNHPNICKLFSHFEDNNFCYFLLQYIPKGSAFDLIPKNGKKQQNMKLIASVMKDLISAIYYLHNMKPTIVHRDIKPENILLDENSKAYLTDFGWSNYIRNDRRRNTICGTPLYLPPEMVFESGHNEKVDIWCIGVLLFELSTGKVPFEGDDYTTVKYNISHLNIAWPSDIEPDVKDLVSKILKKNPEERISIEKILSHNFFNKYFPNAVKELIKPDNQPHKVFIVSVDDPKTWNPIQNRQSSLLNNNNSNNNKIDNNNNKNNNRMTSFEKNHTMYYKPNMNFSPIKENITNNNNSKELIYKMNNTKELKNKINNNIKYKSNTSSDNKNLNFNKIVNKIEHKINYDSTTSYINKNKRNKNYKINTEYNNNNTYISFNKSKSINKNNQNNSNDYSKTIDNFNQNNFYNNNRNKNNYIRNKSYKDNNKEKEYSTLLKKYDSLKKEYDFWKNNELEKLKKELKEKENKLFQLINNSKSYDIIDIENKNKYKKLEIFYEDLKSENNELKEKIKNYTKYLKDKKSNDLKGINDQNKILKNNLDIETQKNVNALIKEKDNQIYKYKEEIRIKREKEKERFSLLINKYDKTLIWQEKENIDLKNKLKELERQFY